MTKFLNGPAANQCLMLKRSPVLLRVVESRGTWDALDQLKDEPSRDEKIYAYTLTEHHGMAFVDGRKFRGCFAMASYKFVNPQPTDAEMRDTSLWHAWCVKNDPRQ